MEQQALRVLVVEDDAPHARILCRLRGAMLAWHSCALQAWRKPPVARAPQPPDVAGGFGFIRRQWFVVIRHTVERYPNCEPFVISMFGDEDSVLASIMGALPHPQVTPHRMTLPRPSSK
jgi:hypothetical protein